MATPRDDPFNGETEFGGRSTDSTVRPAGSAALEGSEKLRLLYRTGQTSDAEAPVDPKIFRGEATIKT